MAKISTDALITAGNVLSKMIDATDNHADQTIFGITFDVITKELENRGITTSDVVVYPVN